MNFTGYVPMRRGILDHLHTGRLSLNEYAALTVLILLADKSSGRGTINAPTLRTFVPELSYPAAKRILKSLEEKRYIWREITPHDKAAYPYWIAGYEPTSGPHKLFRLSIAQVIQSNDPKDIRYLKCVPDPVPEGVPDPEPHPVPNNNKEKEKESETLSSGIRMCASLCSPATAHSEHSKPHNVLTCEPGGEHMASIMCSTCDSDVSEMCRAGDAPDAGPSEAILRMGMEYRDGRYYTSTGIEVHPNILAILSEQSEQGK